MQELKELDAAIPIILISAHGLKDEELGIYKADAFLQKPFKLTMLLATVNEVI